MDANRKTSARKPGLFKKGGCILRIGVPRHSSGLQKEGRTLHGDNRGPSPRLGIKLSDRLLQRCGRVEAFDFYPGDAVAFHLEDGVAAVIEFKAFTAFGNFAELRHHEAGQSLKAFFTRESDVILGFKIAQVEAAIKDDGA